MTDTQLNEMSVTELRDLNHRVIAFIKMKNEIASRLNASKISKGMTVRIRTNNPDLIESTFILDKINKKYGVCRDINSGKSWNVLIGSIYEKQEVA